MTTAPPYIAKSLCSSVSAILAYCTARFPFHSEQPPCQEQRHLSLECITCLGVRYLPHSLAMAWEQRFTLHPRSLFYFRAQVPSSEAATLPKAAAPLLELPYRASYLPHSIVFLEECRVFALAVPPRQNMSGNAVCCTAIVLGRSTQRA